MTSLFRLLLARGALHLSSVAPWCRAWQRAWWRGRGHIRRQKEEEFHSLCSLCSLLCSRLHHIHHRAPDPSDRSPLFPPFPPFPALFLGTRPDLFRAQSVGELRDIKSSPTHRRRGTAPSACTLTWLRACCAHCNEAQAAASRLEVKLDARRLQRLRFAGSFSTWAPCLSLSR